MGKRKRSKYQERPFIVGEVFKMASEDEMSVGSRAGANLWGREEAKSYPNLEREVMCRFCGQVKEAVSGGHLIACMKCFGNHIGRAPRGEVIAMLEKWEGVAKGDHISAQITAEEQRNLEFTESVGDWLFPPGFVGTVVTVLGVLFLLGQVISLGGMIWEGPRPPSQVFLFLGTSSPPAVSLVEWMTPILLWGMAIFGQGLIGTGIYRLWRGHYGAMKWLMGGLTTLGLVMFMMVALNLATDDGHDLRIDNDAINVRDVRLE